MHIIENDILKIQVKSKGAELDSIWHKRNQLEYLWSGDPGFWAKKSPVLFPIVGTLKNDEYYFGGKAYKLSRHGFGREKEFAALQESPTRIRMSLHSSEETLELYPFSFCFDIVYELIENMLRVSYEIGNKGDDDMYLSVGGHPAFKLPLTDDTTYEDYFLRFDKVVNAGRWPISKEGLIEATPNPLLTNTDRLALSKQLFQQDALVFKHLNADSVKLESGKTTHGLEFNFEGFPYLGIWAAKNSDFVCIEPWCGIADPVNSNQQLEDKEGINKLKKGESFAKSWSAKFY